MMRKVVIVSLAFLLTIMPFIIDAEEIKWMEAFNKQEDTEKSKKIRDEFNC
jgi:hypothetical protein